MSDICSRNMSADFRMMNVADLDSVMEIEERLQGVPWSRRGFQDALESAHSRIYVAAGSPGNRILAYCVISFALDEAEIDNYAVREEYRGSGLGGKLLAHVLKTEQEFGITRFCLEVRMNNEPARRMYERAGFAGSGMRKNFYVKPADDALIMVLQTLRSAWHEKGSS